MATPHRTDPELPATPAFFSDPGAAAGSRSSVLHDLTPDERAALRSRLIGPGHVLLGAMFFCGIIATLTTIKLTTGLPIDRSAEIDAVREQVVRAALRDAGGTHGLFAVCVAVEQRADPDDELLDRLDNLGPLVLPASLCLDNNLEAALPVRYVTVRHVLWKYGGRAVVTAGSSRLLRYHVQRRRDGWHVVAVRRA